MASLLARSGNSLKLYNLTLTNVSKKFGSFTAVEEIDITVAADEVLCLLGPSGCGKTTTLRMIAGLESVNSGEVCFGGKDLSTLPAQDRNVAMAFQFYALYPDLSVGENLIFPLAAEGLTSSQWPHPNRNGPDQGLAETLHLCKI